MDTNQKSPTGGYVHFVKTEPKSDKQRIAELTEQRDELLAALSFYVSICGITAHSVTRESAIKAFNMANEAIAKAEKK